MSEGILKFNLPEERSEFFIASKSQGMATAIYNMDNEMRLICKHQPEGVSPIYIQAVEDMRSKLMEFLSDEGISMDDLI